MFMSAMAAFTALTSQLVLLGYLTCSDGEQIPVYGEPGIWANSTFEWPTHEELDLMTRTLWGEARSQSDEEIASIANVIINRVISPRWPSTFAGVIKDPGQFLVWSDGDPNRPLMVRLRTEDISYQRVFAIALDVVSQRYLGYDDPTNGMTHYHHGQDAPYWAANAIAAVQIGDARFYRLRSP